MLNCAIIIFDHIITDRLNLQWYNCDILCFITNNQLNILNNCKKMRAELGP